MRHHYVPQFLLKAWADTSSDQMLEVFRVDLEDIPSRRRAPKALGYERDLYALSTSSVGGIDKQAVETRFLQQLDDSAAQVLRKLSATGSSDLTEQDRVSWTCFLISLLSRTPEAVALIQEVGEAHINASLEDKPEQYEAIADAADPATLPQWLEAHLPGVHRELRKALLAGIRHQSAGRRGAAAHAVDVVGFPRSEESPLALGPSVHHHGRQGRFQLLALAPHWPLEGIHGIQDGANCEHFAELRPEEIAGAHERERGRQRQHACVRTRCVFSAVHPQPFAELQALHAFGLTPPDLSSLLPRDRTLAAVCAHRAHDRLRRRARAPAEDLLERCGLARLHRQPAGALDFDDPSGMTGQFT